MELFVGLVVGNEGIVWSGFIPTTVLPGIDGVGTTDLSASEEVDK
jgi:hypothetical protein